MNTHSCYFLLKVERTDASDLGNNDRGEGSLESPCTKPEDSITVVAGPCTVHILPQVLSKVTYEVTTSKGTIDVRINATGRKSNVTSGFLCPLTSKTGDTSTYSGSAELTPSAGSLGLDMT